MPTSHLLLSKFMKVGLVGLIILSVNIPFEANSLEFHWKSQFTPLACFIIGNGSVVEYGPTDDVPVSFIGVHITFAKKHHFSEANEFFGYLEESKDELVMYAQVITSIDEIERGIFINRIEILDNGYRTPLNSHSYMDSDLMMFYVGEEVSAKQIEKLRSGNELILSINYNNNDNNVLSIPTSWFSLNAEMFNTCVTEATKYQ
ncbi:hypothetical protein L2750_13885 [Shewanella submarina]|uniref:Uncharacterized protein n=1 Tax=Shewanella submarina TaxID=2016376 RepID=A0ABV7GJE5_9GAMM|nr:hypothetical protein [Shewanella submarina]MCL1038234.1 hypothetical protein [Shewanella submarina]